MEMINLIINNIPISVPKGYNIIDAAKLIGVNVPHLCYFPDQEVKAHCRMCVVEVVGSRKLVAACSTLCWEGMEVFTHSPKVQKTQKGILEMILANHNQDCLRCTRNGNCELQDLCSQFNIIGPRFDEVIDESHYDITNPCLIRDLSKCIKCGRCVRMCMDTQGIHALSYSNRSENLKVTTAFNQPMADTDCVLCGQCSTVCPVGAIVEVDDTAKVIKAINDPKKHVVVQVAPSVRVALGEMFSLPHGTIVTGKMVAALRRIGFDRVFDTNFSADLTIMEEGSELLGRLKNGGKLPMITSCSPGWVNYIEKHYSDYLGHLSSAKSPQQMFGAVAKSYYPQVSGVDPKDIVSVSIMPCVAKKFEAKRPEMENDGLRDVDYVLTTRELAKLIKLMGIDFNMLQNEAFDSPLGEASGAGAIFGTTGGVMEAALRTVYEVSTGETLDKIEFDCVRGNAGIKEATIQLGDAEIKVAIAHGLKNAKIVMDRIKSGECDYTFIEIMACPGGCIGGGGQPVGVTFNLKELRQDAIYAIDNSSAIRKSHENPEIKKIYDEFFGAPLSEKSHHFLHTHYKKQNKVTSESLAK